MCIALGGPTEVSNTVLYTGRVVDEEGYSYGNETNFFFYQFSGDALTTKDPSQGWRTLLIQFPGKINKIVNTEEYNNVLFSLMDWQHEWKTRNEDKARGATSTKGIYKQVGMYHCFYGKGIEQALQALYENRNDIPGFVDEDGNPIIDIDENVVNQHVMMYPEWGVVLAVFKGKTTDQPFALEWDGVAPGSTDGQYWPHMREYGMIGCGYFPMMDNGSNDGPHVGTFEPGKKIWYDHTLFYGLPQEIVDIFESEATLSDGTVTAGVRQPQYSWGAFIKPRWPEKMPKRYRSPYIVWKNGGSLRNSDYIMAPSASIQDGIENLNFESVHGIYAITAKESKYSYLGKTPKEIREVTNTV